LLLFQLALSAASPIYRGYLVDRDCRWDVVSAAVDCRTREERGLEPLVHDRFRIYKSRYDSIDSYLSDDGAPYNDIELVYDPEIYAQLRAADVDHLLAQHIAHLFIRDPISLFAEKINQNDEEEIDHFEVWFRVFNVTTYNTKDTKSINRHKIIPTSLINRQDLPVSNSSKQTSQSRRNIERALLMVWTGQLVSLSKVSRKETKSHNEKQHQCQSFHLPVVRCSTSLRRITIPGVK
jgi:hypothetical protein